MILLSRHIVKMDLFSKKQKSAYYWKDATPAVKWLGITIHKAREASCYWYWSDEPVKLPEDCYVENGHIYYLPFIFIKMDDGSTQEIYFDKLSDAEAKYTFYQEKLKVPDSFITV